ncbi:RHS repeat domain-containing protein [Piscirickettsia litoralis]|uniref:Sugar-binding protein n=1 Tax=Piscirickettsia litoralis TaxID=1891921 RepID=A0ABX3A4T5_9GAMM|nr:RHS repeat domain-containing protein [Piscirickettsia litoralis]ODN43252.1 hypothetical protein BGC07_10400 [Piscirickettsia litoralis]
MIKKITLSLVLLGLAGANFAADQTITTRTKTLSYHEDTTNWIFKPAGEVIKNSSGWVANSTSLTYDSRGNLTSKTVNGVTTKYTYSHGNLATVTNALGYTTSFSDYKMGLPQTITDAEGHVSHRVVNNDGTVASVTDAMGDKTSYQYDNMFRLVTTIPAQGLTTSTHWNYPKVGDYVVYKGQTPNYYGKYVTVNGFGKPTQIEIHAGSNSTVISKQEIRYDAYGREIFRSYSVDPKAMSDQTLGIYTTHDPLGRIHTSTAAVALDKIGDGYIGFPDTAGTYTTRYYYAIDHTTVDDPRGVATLSKYQSFGNPDDKQLTEINQGNGAVITDMVRDVSGRLDFIRQKGSYSNSKGTYTRVYHHDSHFF